MKRRKAMVVYGVFARADMSGTSGPLTLVQLCANEGRATRLRNRIAANRNIYATVETLRVERGE